MIDWLFVLCEQLCVDEVMVRVTVIATRGSVPRDPGTSMLVSRAAVWGTIGGGHLEWDAIGQARQLMEGHPPYGGETANAKRTRYALGASLGQCCGGAVELSFERFDRADLAFLQEGLARRGSEGPLLLVSRWRADLCWLRLWVTKGSPVALGAAACASGGLADHSETLAALLAADGAGPRAMMISSLSLAARKQTPAGPREDLWLERVDPALNPLWIFGAGHVARALVPVLDGLPFSVSWIDSRSDAFPPAEGLSERISSILTDDPAGEIARAPRDAIHLVMTHNHDLDFAICRALLRRGEFRRLGLIGSDTKARRFAQRFAAQGVPPSQIARVVSPIGVAGIDSKLPAAIAVAIAAQLLQWIEISEPSSASDANIPAAPTTPFSSGIKA